MKKLWPMLALCLTLLMPGQSRADEIVDLNAISREDWLELPLPIDPDLAEAVILYREENGAFAKPEDLMKVPGMDDAAFDLLYPFMLRDRLVIEVEMPRGMSPY